MLSLLQLPIGDMDLHCLLASSLLQLNFERERERDLTMKLEIETVRNLGHYLLQVPIDDMGIFVLLLPPCIFSTATTSEF